MSGIGAASPHSGMPPFNSYPYRDYPDPYTPPGTTNSSPRGGYAAFAPPPGRSTSTQSPQRPATRAHFHSVSTSATPVFCNEYASPRPPTASPRYNSEGHYSTANDMPSRPTTTSRRPSMTTPQRPATTMPRTNHSSSRKVSSSRPTESRSPPPKSPQQPRQATDEDAKKHHIPTGFSLKNWDPRQRPILLLGSVFDANSLGKWIYDWTVHHHGASSVEAEHAGHLWLFIIQVYGKIHAGDHVVLRIRNRKDRDLVDSYLNDAEKLVETLEDILKGCEKPMLSVDKGKGSRALGNNSGVEFVKTMFGSKLKNTLALIDEMSCFLKDWEKHCEDIVRNPTR
ncbi:hypothetical protein TD95_003639 [Thielaviopsis punctulata]|uniref:Vegetative cell wall protein gp1 n=1 Tax=Thielaviopsis punctulata TaxID=72032 RepID=A0A0F4Z8H9_9PEZI|nr:hypothetical protein TD95_003639 [Thielaviopsis punctulata]